MLIVTGLLNLLFSYFYFFFFICYFDLCVMRFDYCIVFFIIGRNSLEETL